MSRDSLDTCGTEMRVRSETHKFGNFESLRLEKLREKLFCRFGWPLFVFMRDGQIVARSLASESMVAASHSLRKRSVGAYQKQKMITFAHILWHMGRLEACTATPVILGGSFQN